MADSFTILLPEGTKADRFRIYATTTTTSKRDGALVQHEVEEVAAEGKIDKSGTANIDQLPSGATRVVFYQGPVDEEIVVAAADVPKGTTGPVSIKGEVGGEAVAPAAEPTE